MKELVEDRSHGFIVSSRDPSALTETIRDIASGCYDLVKMGIRAREKIERFAQEDSHYNQLMDIYKNVIQLKKGG